MATSILNPETAGPQSTLNPENMNLPDRELGKGHGTDALGPSDLSDTGSDVHGGIGLAHQIDLPLDTGTTSDPEESTAGYTEGPDIGDANLDSDSDATGTGERATASRDTVVSDGQDIDTDHIERINDGGEDDLHDRGRHGRKSGQPVRSNSGQR